MCISFVLQVRIDASWRLIDLDAAAKLGFDPVGAKHSSAYVPPEAVFVDPQAGPNGLAVVRSEAHRASYVAGGGQAYELLVAHPSYDIWSLGCVFFQVKSYSFFLYLYLS